MNDAHHAPPNEYDFGILVVHRLENGADNEWRTVQIYYPHRTRGYWSRMHNGPEGYHAENWLPWVYIPTHNELNAIPEQKASTKVSKTGDTMTGTLNFAHSNSHIIGRINDSDYYRITGIATNQNNGYLEIAVADDTDEGIVVRQYGNKGGYNYGDFSNLAREAWLLNSNGDTSFPQAVTANTFYTNDWFRVNTDGGIHWQKYGGGWYMTDKEWIRAWGGKSIYTSGKIRCDAGFEGELRGTADNANKLGGYTLEQVIAMAKR